MAATSPDGYSAAARRRRGAMTRGAALAFDLGGTRIKAGVVSLDDDRVLERATADTPADGEGALRAVREIGEGLRARHPCVGVGLAVPGLVDDDGVLVALPGKLPGLAGRDLRAELRRAFALPAVVSNDAIAYGVGESAAGAAALADRALVVTIGTGVGVAVIERGRPISRGPTGGGILGGAIPIRDDDGPVDSSGRRGTIEALCAAARIVDRARAAGGAASSVPEVFAAARAGDPAAIAGLDRYRADLVRALIALCHAHAPSVVVVGGGPLPAGGPLLDTVEEAVNRGLWPGYPFLRVTRAVLGDEAALIGLGRLLERA